MGTLPDEEDLARHVMEQRWIAECRLPPGWKGIDVPDPLDGLDKIAHYLRLETQCLADREDRGSVWLEELRNLFDNVFSALAKLNTPNLDEAPSAFPPNPDDAINVLRMLHAWIARQAAATQPATPGPQQAEPDAATAEALQIIAGKLEKALRERPGPAEKPQKRRPGMSQAEAEAAVARLLQQKPPGGGRWSVTSLKERIDRQGEQTITRERIIAAPAWVGYKATRPTKSKRAVAFSAAVEATAASNEPSPLDALIAEQEADYEPSPVTTRGKRPKAFKRL